MDCTAMTDGQTTGSSGLWLVTNEASGSNSADAVQELQAAFATGGMPVARTLDIRSGLPGRQELERSGVDVLAVFTGDGTVNAAATALEGWGGALLVLPGGTANLLSRELHGEMDAAQIAVRLGALVRTRRHCIRTSQGTALIEILAGPGATWSDVREEMRDGAVGEMANKAVTALRQSTTGPMVAIANPPLGRAEGYSGIRLQPSGPGAPEGMLIEGYGAETVADYLRQGLALLRRNFRDGPHDDLGAHVEIHCRSLESAPIPLMIDGERRDGGPAERFSLAPFALDLLASRT